MKPRRTSPERMAVVTQSRVVRRRWDGRRALGFAIVLVAVFGTPSVRAQVLGPALDRHTLEVGYTYKWYERDFDSVFLGKEDWSSAAFYFRYGTCRWATIGFEGGVWTLDHPDFPTVDYRRYTFGGGLTALLWRQPRWRLEVSAHYSEIFDHDRSENQFHKNTRDITAALELERSFALGRHSIRVRGGPAVVYDQSRQYPWLATAPVKNDTPRILGFTAGVNIVVSSRLSAFSHVVYADAFQPRLGVGIRF